MSGINTLLALLGRGDAPPIVPIRGWSAPLTTLTSLAMGFLAVLTLSAGIAAGRLAETWRADLAGVATVSLTAAADVIDDRLTQTLEVLRTTPGLTDVRELTPEEQTALLEPWLGDDLTLDALPAPRLIEVVLEGDGPDAARLQARLDQTAPGARYDDHQAWRGPLAKAAAALQTLAWGATLLVTLAAAGVIGLSAQATLAGNRDVVRVVRLIGAEDRFIIRAFVSRIALRAFGGATAGAVLALGALALLPSLEGGGGIGLQLSLGAGTSLTLAVVVPLGAMAVALLTALIAVRLQLRQLD